MRHMHHLKIRISAFSGSILMTALGIDLITVASLGTSPISSVPLVISLYTPWTFSLLERGEISVPEFCNELRRLGCRAETDAEIVKAWEDYLTEVPTERLDMLLKIRQHYSVNCLSNTNEIHWHQAEADFFQYKGHGVGDFFDHVFLSCRLGLEKPAPVSAMSRFLPMRFARSAWPIVLFTLCAPVWLRSSRLRTMVAPPR